MTYAPTIELTILHPIQAMMFAHASTMAPYQPKENLVNVKVRRPVLGPKVAMYAGGIMPMRLKKKIVRNKSHHPMYQIWVQVCRERRC